MSERERRWEQVLRFMGETQARLDQLEAEVARLKAKPKRTRSKGRLTDEEQAVAARVIAKLNEHGGHKLRADSGGKPTRHVHDIVARLRKGATEHELRLVAWHKGTEWRDTEMRQYIRPETLFCDKHWDAYLDAARVAYEERTGQDPDNYEPPPVVVELAAKLRSVQ